MNYKGLIKVSDAKGGKMTEKEYLARVRALHEECHNKVMHLMWERDEAIESLEKEFIAQNAKFHKGDQVIYTGADMTYGDLTLKNGGVYTVQGVKMSGGEFTYTFEGLYANKHFAYEKDLRPAK